jgi:hypothetical protein
MDPTPLTALIVETVCGAASATTPAKAVAKKAVADEGPRQEGSGEEALLPRRPAS